MSVIATIKIVTGILIYCTIYIHPRNKKWITVVKYISTIKWAFLFMLIFTNKINFFI